jgi:hypothetical protein
MELNENSKGADGRCEYVTARGVQCKRAAVTANYCKQHYGILFVKAKDDEKKLKAPPRFWTSFNLIAGLA